ncbi:MAG: hypothetical protein ACRDB0_00015 [Paraclostridium sp.]
MDYGRLILWSFLFVYCGIKFIKSRGLGSLYFSLMGLYGLTSVNFILQKDRSLELIKFLDTPIIMFINITIVIILGYVISKIIKQKLIFN